MDQKKMHNHKQLPKALNQEELRQVKGGYRELVSLSAGSQFVRWDEVDIRFGEDTDTLQGPQTGSTGSGVFRMGRQRR